MTRILLHPCYFGPISQFVALVKAEEMLLEVEDNYQKQTYRNRMYIYGANGKLSLNIPVKHSKATGKRQKYKEVKIENSFNWQKQHWRSLQNVYRTSAFFEFYEDEFQPLYEKKHKFLLDLNLECLDLVLNCLDSGFHYEKTEAYVTHPEKCYDGRTLVQAKRKQEISFQPYPQVFQDRFGFLTNLSILDLLFNEGPGALNYLKNQSLEI